MGEIAEREILRGRGARTQEGDPVLDAVKRMVVPVVSIGDGEC
jgi:hypothetical protein